MQQEWEWRPWPWWSHLRWRFACTVHFCIHLELVSSSVAFWFASTHDHDDDDEDGDDDDEDDDDAGDESGGPAGWARGCDSASEQQSMLRHYLLQTQKTISRGPSENCNGNVTTSIRVLSQILNLIRSNYAYSCLGFRKLYNVLLPCFSREASRQMTDIETFFSKQM